MADRTEPEAANQVTVVATSLTLRNAWQLRRFFRLNGVVTRQLDGDPTGMKRRPGSRRSSVCA